MKITTAKTLILSAGALLLAAGCSGPTKAYPGDTRSASETATLRPQGVTLRKVNGVDIGFTSSGATILPGTNEIELTVDASNFNVRDHNTVYKLRLEAQPGATYAITGQRGDGRLCAFPIDGQSGLPDFKAPAGCLYRE